MDFSTLLTLKQAWDTFKRNHPKFPDFISAVAERGAVEGTEVLISVSYPNGQNYKAGLKLKASDMALLEQLKSLR